MLRRYRPKSSIKAPQEIAGFPFPEVGRVGRFGPIPVIFQPARVLIVEGEIVIAKMMEEITRAMGFRVSGVAHTVRIARLELAKCNFDVVLLDTNLWGQSAPEAADLLIQRGVRFAFVTDDEYVVEPRHDKVPLLQKPFTPAELCLFLEELVAPSLLG